MKDKSQDYEVVVTGLGREIQLPLVRATGARKRKNDMVKLWDVLLKEAVTEAELMCNSHMSFMLGNMNVKQLTIAECEVIRQFLRI